MSDTQLSKGRFYEVQGLEYGSPTMAGITNEKGEFEYREGEAVTFSIGGIVLGSALGDELLTPAHLVLEVGGNVKWIKNARVTNIARFLQSLSKDGNVENGVVITDEIRNTAKRYRYKISFTQSEEAFAADTEVKALCAELEVNLRTGAQARNHLRRTLHGIKKLTNVKVPARDGSYFLADVYCPIKEGRYPVILSHGGYGKAFWFGCICNDEDLLKFEEREDAYFEGAKTETPFIHFHFEIAGQVPPPELPPPGSPPNPPLPHVSEYFERPNTLDWVPQGYVVMMSDGRGTGRSPGVHHALSLQEAEDYYDVIEWAGHRPWSNGNVGLYAASIYAMGMFNTAQFQPPSLKAMIPVNGDIDSYRDYLYVGGLYNPFNFIPKISCGEWRGVDFVGVAQANPFYDPEFYGPRGKGSISPDVKKITVPFWSSFGIELPVHTRGASEAFIHAASPHKKLTILSEPGIHFWMFAPEFLKEQLEFFDHWLKGIENGIMDRPPVRMMIRTGWGGYYWQDEQEWPITRTQYTKYYLDADPSGGKMGKTSPVQEHSSTYAADAPQGVSFLSEPMASDTVVAGYIKMGIWVSATSHDMAVGASLRVVDENDVEVAYAVDPNTTRVFAGGLIHPLAKGALKVSHRKLDPARSTVYRPFHTHLKEDYQPLASRELVECEVEFWPTTAVLRKGWRVRLDVGPGLDPLDTSYQKGAMNTIYTGPDHASYIQLPVIPTKQ